MNLLTEYYTQHKTDIVNRYVPFILGAGVVVFGYLYLPTGIEQLANNLPTQNEDKPVALHSYPEVEWKMLPPSGELLKIGD